MNLLNTIWDDLPPDSWKVGLLLCGAWLTVASDQTLRGRWPLHLVLFLVAIWTAITDDLFQVLGGLSLSHWLACGLLANSAETREETSTDWERWCFFQLLADLLMMSGLALIDPLLTATNITAIRSSDLWQMGIQREPALVWLAGFLVLGSMAVRLGQYPSIGWLKAAARNPSGQFVSLGILMPLTVVAWIQVFPLFAMSRDLRILGVGLGLLSLLMLGFLLVATTKVGRLPCYLASGGCGLGILASVISPEFGIEVALPLTAVVLIGLAIQKLLTIRHQPESPLLVVRVIVLMVGLLILRIAGPAFTSLNAAAVPDGDLAALAGQSIFLQGLFAVSLLLLAGGILRSLRIHAGTNSIVEEKTGCKNETESTTYVRLADTEFSLDAILDYAVAWPLWCFLLVVTYLAEFCTVTLPGHVSKFLVSLTSSTLDDLDHPDAGSLHWELILGTVAVLLLALFASHTGVQL